MDTIKTKDGTEIFYKDWGSGKTVVFSHGWPLNADAWDSQMLFMVQKGYRVIAHDRRGHGRSGQPGQGNDMDTYADDLAAVLDALDVKDAMPKDVFDGIRAGVAGDRSQFYKDLALPFFGYNRDNAKKSQGVIDTFWAQGMLGGILGHYLCIKEFSEVDYTEDLKKFDVPTLILHGDDDQIVPIDAAGRLSAKIVKNATLKVYPGGAHGMCVVEADKVNADLLEFASS